MAFATATPSSDRNGHWGTSMSTTNGDDPNRKHTTLILADDHYCKMYGLKLLAGRFLEASDTTYVSRTVPEDKQVCMAVVNEKLVRELGFKSNEDAIEKPFWFGMNNGKVQIVGVVADFNTGSLHEHISPTTIISFPIYSQAGIKIEAGSNIPETIAAIEKAWKKVYPEGVFEFKFLDAQIDAFYKAEERLYQLFKIFAGLAMLISCLGLWGSVNPVCSTTHEGNRNPKSAGCLGRQNCGYAVKRFFHHGLGRACHCIAPRLLPC